MNLIAQGIKEEEAELLIVNMSRYAHDQCQCSRRWTEIDYKEGRGG
jgi:hypothetical protein